MAGVVPLRQTLASTFAAPRVAVKRPPPLAASTFASPCDTAGRTLWQAHQLLVTAFYLGATALCTFNSLCT